MDKYNTLKQLGDGTFGSVLLATIKNTGEQVAIKRFVLSQKSQIRIHSKKKNSRLQLLLFNNHLLLRWCSQSLSSNLNLIDPWRRGSPSCGK